MKITLLLVCFLAWPSDRLSGQSREARLCMPTTVGTKWVYDENGKEVTEVITASEVKDGTRSISLGRLAADGRVTPTEKLLVTDWCIFRVEKNGIPEKPHASLLILPLAIGGVSNAVAQAKPDWVDVPYGSYMAYPVRLQSLVPIPLSKNTVRFHETRWYSPGIGLLKNQCGYEIGDVKVNGPKRVLKKLTVGKE